MLFELGSEFYGSNNGDLSATYKILKDRGWSSKESISKAIQELESAGFIVKTRQGGRNCCSLYAFSFQPIYGNRKLDAGWAEHGRKYPAPHTWKD